MTFSKASFILLLLLPSIINANPQRPESRILTYAAHCLVAKGLVVQSSLPKSTFGYTFNTKSYPGKTIMYVVHYAALSSSRGSVFAIVLTTQGDHQTFDIQNNAGFALSKHGSRGVIFETPPLGGDWTQKQLASAVMLIGKRPKIMISSTDLLMKYPSVSCESYTDQN